MPAWEQYLLIAAGSAAGGMARFWLGTHITAAWGPLFPWGTLAVNLLGSLVIGFAAGWAHLHSVRFLAMIGLCGGFTTFSSFSLENLNLIRQGDWQRAAAYSAVSVAGCLLTAAAGLALNRLLK